MLLELCRRAVRAAIRSDALRRAFVASLLVAVPFGTVGASGSGPVVVVYPLTVAGPKSEVGATIATLLATKLTALGDLTVKPYAPGTERPQFLDAAIGLGADYYITGFLTPVGSEVSLIAQVVSTHSGSIVYSATSLVRTYADTLTQADILREAILRHAGRGFAALDRPAPEPSQTPAPTIANGGVNLSKALGRKKRSAPTAAIASPEASSAAVAAGPSLGAAGGAPVSVSAAPSAAPSRSVAAVPVRTGKKRRPSAPSRLSAAELPPPFPAASSATRSVARATAAPRATPAATTATTMPGSGVATPGSTAAATASTASPIGTVTPPTAAGAAASVAAAPASAPGAGATPTLAPGAAGTTSAGAPASAPGAGASPAAAPTTAPGTGPTPPATPAPASAAAGSEPSPSNAPDATVAGVASPVSTAAAPGSATSASPTGSPASTARTAGVPVRANSPRSSVASRPGAGTVGLVVRVRGDATTAELGRATTAFARALRRDGVSGGILPIAASDIAANAPALCAANAGSRGFYAGMLAADTRETATTLAFDVAVYDCTGAVVGRSHASTLVGGRGIDDAIDRVTSDAAAAAAKIALPPVTPA